MGPNNTLYIGRSNLLLHARGNLPCDPTGGFDVASERATIGVQGHITDCDGSAERRVTMLSTSEAHKGSPQASRE
jgi:hypothetical protein